jgi:DNA-binding CsgD family transcriptional regulator
VGVDAQLVGAFAKARQALRTHRYGELAGLLVLGCALAWVGFLAALIFAVQQADGLSTAAALAQLGLDQQSWLVQRAALSVLLVCLSGWTRYHPPSKAQTLARERAHLEQELALAPLRQRLRRQQATGFASLARSSVDALLGREAHTDGATPADETDDQAADSADRRVSANPLVSSTVHLGSNGGRSNALRRHGNRRHGSRPMGVRTGALRSRPNAAERAQIRTDREAQVAAWLVDEPTISIREIARRLGCSQSTASELRHVVEARLGQMNERAA